MLRAIVVAVLLLGLTGPARAQNDDGRLHFFRIATGNAASTLFQVGSAVATAISSPPGSPSCDSHGPCGVRGLVAVAQSSDGSVANVLAVAQGRVDSAFAQADVINWAFTGERTYFRRAPQPNLRVIANLYPETVHLVVRRGAGIKAVRDLNGRRISIDKPGSGNRLNVELILTAFGVRLAQIKPIEVDLSEATDLFVKDELDAFFVIAGYPATVVKDLAEMSLADLLPLTGRQTQTVLRRQNFFSIDTIPADTYKGIPEIPTLAVGVQWVVSDTADPDLIYRITKALWNPKNQALLDSGRAKAEQLRLSSALDGITIPLHPGAERFYKEAGVLYKLNSGD